MWGGEDEHKGGIGCSFGADDRWGSLPVPTSDMGAYEGGLKQWDCQAAMEGKQIIPLPQICKTLLHQGNPLPQRGREGV